MVIRAVCARRQVLTNNKGWFAYMVPTFALGSMCDVENPALGKPLREHRAWDWVLAALPTK